MHMEFKINWYTSLPSTNTFLKEQVEAQGQMPSGTVVAAKEQTRGRGRMAREWKTSANENLTFSVLLADHVNAQRCPSSAMAAALAIADLLKKKGISADLKWPNDVLVKGRKICGILSERISTGLIIGIGLNVNMQSAAHIDQPATSMRIETGECFDMDDLLPELLGYLSIRLDQWRQGGFSNLRNDWEANVPSIGKMVTVRDGDLFREGVLAGFGEYGELLLQDALGHVDSIWAGDVSA